MSYQERHSGKIIKLEEAPTGILDAEDEYAKDDYMYENKIIEVNSEFYQLINDREHQDDSDFCDIVQQEDGTFNYHASYYNGRTYLNEVIEEALKRIITNE